MEEKIMKKLDRRILYERFKKNKKPHGGQAHRVK